MSLGLPPIKEELHRAGIQLLELQKGYYKIFGGNSAAPADFELACLANWLKNYKRPDAPRGIHEYFSVYNAVVSDLNTIISSFDLSPSASQMSVLARQRIKTVRAYAQANNLEEDTSSLRFRCQSYKFLLETIYAGKRLSSLEESTRLEFLAFTEFFH